MNATGHLLLAGLAILLIAACSQQTEYERMVQRELAREIRKDSLFLGYELGMSRDEFYNYSWELNEKQLVKEGPRNMSVEYDLGDRLPHPARMNFYPDFSNGKIYRMRVAFTYKGWAPWNKDLAADSLILDVKDLMEKWYGEGFITVNDPQKGLTHVKVDANRKISIFKKGDGMTVQVFFRDLTAGNTNS